MVFFVIKKLFSLMRSHLLSVILSTYITSVLFRKLPSVPMSSRPFSTFYPIIFSVSGLILRFLVHLELSFVHSEEYGSICVLLHAGTQLDQHHLLNYFPGTISGFVIKYQVSDVCSLQFDSIGQCAVIFSLHK